MDRRGANVPLKGSLSGAPSCHRVVLVLAGVCLVLQLMLAQAVFHHDHGLGAGGSHVDCVACQVATTCLADSSPLLTSSASILPEPTYVVPSPRVSYSTDFLYWSHQDRAPPLT